jgi:hypothetical protein
MGHGGLAVRLAVSLAVSPLPSAMSVPTLCGRRGLVQLLLNLSSLLIKDAKRSEQT